MQVRQDPSHASPLRVLLVEDHVDDAKIMALLFNQLGYEVHMAADGPTALEVAEAIRPDVILLDIGLPGMDGWEVAGRLRPDPSANRPYIVVITGNGQREDYRRSRQVGIDLHMTKPADPVELEDILRRFESLVAR